MAKYVMGDIHGCLDKLKECLNKVNFDYENDTLIQLGDVVDRGPNSYGVVEELMKIKHLIAIRGNHDDGWMNTLCFGNMNALWSEGGKETFFSYRDNNALKNESHHQFFLNQVNYYIDGEDLFVHGGFDRHRKIEEQDKTILCWDRDLWLAALGHEAMRGYTSYKFKIKDKFKRIFIGHSPTQMWGYYEPMKAANIINIDTGSGKGGNLTIMNVETEEYWQSK